MSSEVQTMGSNLPANPEALLSGLANMGHVANQDASGGRGQFMKFAKGAYSYGPESIDVEEASLWAVNPKSFVHGYQAWGDGELLEEQVAGMNEPPIVKSNLATHMYIHPEAGTEVKAKWNPYRGFVLVCASGEDEGVQCFISGTSMGLKNAVDTLVGAIVEHVGEDPGTPVAIIELKVDSYEHKKWGKTFVPIFDVVEWADMEATEVPDFDDELENEGPAGADANPSSEDPDIVNSETLANDENGTTPAEEVKPARSRRGRKRVDAEAEPAKTEQVRTRRRRGA